MRHRLLFGWVGPGLCSVALLASVLAGFAAVTVVDSRVAQAQDKRRRWGDRRVER